MTQMTCFLRLYVSLRPIIFTKYLFLVTGRVGKLGQNQAQIPRFSPNMELKRQSDNLPIYPMRPEILQAIDTHQVTIISGETGSGKTTQVPQYLLQNAMAKGEKIRIICTEPRRIAAISVADRVAQEMATKVC